MPFKYQSGEEIKPGDRVLLYGTLSGEITLVADPDDPLSDPHDWYIEVQGGGVMIAEPKEFGYLFLHDKQSIAESLVLVARGKPRSEAG